MMKRIMILVALLTSQTAMAQFPTPVSVPVMIMTLNTTPINMSLPGPYTIPFTGAAFTLSVTTTMGAATYTGGILTIPTPTLAGLGGVGLSAFSATAPLYYNYLTGQFSIPSANTGRDGYLLQGDWNTFNGKQNSITFSTTGSSGAATFSGGALNIPNYTLAGLGGIGLGALSASAPLSYNNTTGAFTIAQANTSTDGYVSHTDWNTFNGKQNAITFSTTGSSGAATLSGGALNIPNYTLAGLGGIGLTALSSTATGLTYTNTTGVFSLTSGYMIPTTTQATNWTSAYSNMISSFSTTGSSGAATFSGGALNIPNYSLSGMGGIGSIVAGNNVTTTASGTTVTVNAVPSGAQGYVGFYNGGLWAGSSVLNIGTADGNVLLSAATNTAVPTAPATGYLKPYTNSNLGLEELHSVNSLGTEYIYGTELGTHQLGRFMTNGSSPDTWDGIYLNAISFAGTKTYHLRTPDATNNAPNYLYVQLSAAASPNTSCEYWYGFSGRDALINNSLFGGGSKMDMMFCLPNYVSTQKFFAGYTNSIGQNNTVHNPSTFTNIIALAKDSTDATFYFMFNDNTGTATKINTGITPTANDVYLLRIYLPSNTTEEGIELIKMTKTSAVKASYVTTTDIPAAQTLMYWHLQSNSGAASVAPSFGLIGLVEEIYNH